MKLATFRTRGDDRDRIGVATGDSIFEILDSDGHPPWPSLLALIEGGDEDWDRWQTYFQRGSGQAHAVSDVELRAPIPRPPQYRDAMCFHEHIRQSFPGGQILAAMASGDEAAVRQAKAAAEAFEVPTVHRQIPVYYKGNRFAVGHPDQTVQWPTYSQAMDFELELACVIGRGGKDIAADQAEGHIFGYMILNDLSARDAQGLEMQGLLGPAKGKDFDNANVFGPYLVTADEIGDPYDLSMCAYVNGTLWCDGHSSTMNWTFGDLIARISEGETLYPGEIIGSGTVGNGCGLEHLRLLSDGDVIELQVEKIGSLRTTVAASTS